MDKKKDLDAGENTTGIPSQKQPEVAAKRKRLGNTSFLYGREPNADVQKPDTRSTATAAPASSSEPKITAKTTKSVHPKKAIPKRQPRKRSKSIKTHQREPVLVPLKVARQSMDLVTKSATSLQQKSDPVLQKQKSQQLPSQQQHPSSTAVQEEVIPESPPLSPSSESDDEIIPGTPPPSPIKSVGKIMERGKNLLVARTSTSKVETESQATNIQNLNTDVKGPIGYIPAFKTASGKSIILSDEAKAKAETAYGNLLQKWADEDKTGIFGQNEANPEKTTQSVDVDQLPKLSIYSIPTNRERESSESVDFYVQDLLDDDENGDESWTGN